MYTRTIHLNISICKHISIETKYIIHLVYIQLATMIKPTEKFKRQIVSKLVCRVVFLMYLSMEWYGINTYQIKVFVYALPCKRF